MSGERALTCVKHGAAARPHVADQRREQEAPAGVINADFLSANSAQTGRCSRKLYRLCPRSAARGSSVLLFLSFFLFGSQHRNICSGRDPAWKRVCVLPRVKHPKIQAARPERLTFHCGQLCAHLEHGRASILLRLPLRQPEPN